MIVAALALIAGTTPLRLEELVEVTDLSGLAASPDGRWLAVRLERPSVARNQVELSWAVMPSDGSAPPHVVADGGVATSNGAGVLEDERPVWSADSKALVYRARIRGKSELWRVVVASGQVTRLTTLAGDVLRFGPTPDGTGVTVETTEPVDAFRARHASIGDQGARLDAAIDLSVGVIGGFDRGAGPEDVRMTGDWFDRQPSTLPTRFYKLDLSSGETSSIARPGATAGEPEPDLRSVCQVLDCSTNRLMSVISVPGRNARLATMMGSGRGQSLWLIENDRARRLAESPGQLSGARRAASPCVATAQRVICVAAEAAMPPRLVGIDQQTGEMRTLFAPNRTLAARLPATARSVQWRDGDGHAFSGVLFLPPGRSAPTPSPLVIQYYVCEGFLRGGVGDELPFQMLAAQGIASLCINRPAPRSPPRSALQDYRTAQNGIKAIVRTLTRDKLIDARRIGMQGLSFGSEVTMWLWRRTRLLRAAAISSGQIEPTLYWFQSFPGRDTPVRLRTDYGLSAPDHTGPWRVMAPARSLGRGRAPLLLQLAESEARWSIELITRLARSGRPADTIIYPAAGHVKFLPRQRLSAMRRMLEWFRYWLSAPRPPQHDADAMAGWRKLDVTGSDPM